jgi:dihydroorotate dehydrogenase
MMFELARRILLRLPPELAHGLSLRGMELAQRVGYTQRVVHPIYKPVELLGLKFRNRVGLAAGLDKDGVAIRGLFALGFGFVEVGTVTPRPQPGNAKPRLFRLPGDGALINRMGFNNAGTAALRERLVKLREQPLGPGCVVGVNIGKNRDTALPRASDDYLEALRGVHDVADYIAVNVSSPNTPGLRKLQGARELQGLLRAVLAERDALVRGSESARGLPVLAKLAPDLDSNELAEVADVLIDVGVDGVIASNTTTTRPLEAASRYAAEQGGLSGCPLNPLAARCIEHLQRRLAGRLPIIGVGGIDDVGSATRLIDAGASLVQLYTGFIYRGPQLIREIALALDPELANRELC